MNRNDRILLTIFGIVLGAFVLIAFAPVEGEATFSVRVWAVANSPISIAVFSTFIAAFAGTWGAQLLAERAAARRALLSELRGTNVALGLAFTIANTYIATKKQAIRNLVQDYEAQSVARREHYASSERGTPFAARLELETINPPFSPIDALRDMLNERITPDGRALILLTPLTQSIQGFSEAAIQRNAWIAEVRAMPAGTDAIKAAWFFGVPYGPSRTDERYPGFIRALKAHTDDCIGFSILIARSLSSYGERLAARYGDGAPKISTAKFDKAADLLPDMDSYADWTRN